MGRAAVLLAAALLGCSSDEGEPSPPGGTGGSSGTGGTGAGVCASDGEVFLTDATNYTFESSIDVQHTVLKDATDLTFDWSGLTKDLFGRPMDPAEDIDLVLISLWNMSPDELEQNLSSDNLPLSQNEGVLTTYPDGSYTSRNLLAFDLLMAPLPEEEVWLRFDTNHPDFAYPQAEYTFMLTANNGTALNQGARMIAFFNVDPSATQTELELSDQSATLAYTVDLDTAQPVRVPAGQPNVTLSWRDMTVNALGNEFRTTQINDVVVAHFPSSSLEDLESQFLQLESLADGWWTGEVAAGASIDLGTLEDANQGAFPGIDDTGIWMVGLFCTTNCNNPAPWLLTVLEPCE